jgi:hypothetical protein
MSAKSTGIVFIAFLTGWDAVDERWARNWEACISVEVD